MERAGATPLSFGPPSEGAPPAPMEQSLAKRPRPPAEAEQVRATRVAPHGPWPRPHHPPLTRPTTSHGTQDADSEDDNNNMGDSDAIYDLSLHQAGDIILNDTAVYAAMVELLLELEGVDPEPDFWDAR
eukprot:scaffold41244_cov30-Tisochrysis_lutea.AAC.6